MVRLAGAQMRRIGPLRPLPPSASPPSVLSVPSCQNPSVCSVCSAGRPPPDVLRTLPDRVRSYTRPAIRGRPDMGWKAHATWHGLSSPWVWDGPYAPPTVLRPPFTPFPPVKNPSVCSVFSVGQPSAVRPLPSVLRPLPDRVRSYTRTALRHLRANSRRTTSTTRSRSDSLKFEPDGRQRP